MGSEMESACDLCFNTKLKLPLVGPILASAITSGHETLALLVATSHLWAQLARCPFPGKDR